MAKFGEIVKAARQSKQLTLNRMARRIGTGKGYLCWIERGTVHPPSPKLVRKMSSVLGLDLNTMLALSHAEKAPKEVQQKFVELANTTIWK